MATSGSWEISWQSSYWDQPSNPKYYHWSGNWTKSGNTITLSGMKLWMSFTYVSGGYGVTDVVSTTGGSSYTISYPNFSNTYQTDKVSLNNSSFTVGSTATSATISCVISGENTGSTTINFDATYVAPTTPTISATALNTTQVSITYGTTSFGRPNSGTVTLYGGTSANPTTVIDTTTSTGDKTFTHTGLNPGTTYYYRARANNGQLNSNYSTELSATTDVATLYGSVNDEAKRIEKLYGSVDQPYTVYGVGSITNNLVSGATLTTQYRATYGAMLVAPSELEVIVDSSTTSVTLKFSDNSTQVLFSYTGTYTNQGLIWGFEQAPANGVVSATTSTEYKQVAKLIDKLYGSVNGVTKRIY